MAMNRSASAVVSSDAINPSYPWREAVPSSAPDPELGIEAEWRKAYVELHASDADPTPIGSSPWNLATHKLNQLRAVWPLLQLGEIRSMKRRPPT